MRRIHQPVPENVPLEFDRFWKNEGKKSFQDKRLEMYLQFKFLSEDKNVLDKVFTKDFVNASIFLALKSYYFFSNTLFI